MKIVNISEAKMNLSKLVALVYRGEKVVIAKNNLPLVDLVVHRPEGKRKLGLLGGCPRIAIFSKIEEYPKKLPQAYA